MDYVKKISELEAQLQISSKPSIKSQPTRPEIVPQSPQSEVVPKPSFSESSNIDSEPVSKPEMSNVGYADSTRKCPICGNQRKAMIHEELDKTNIIMSYPRMYGKKFRCGECGSEWRINLEGDSVILKDSSKK
jgi:hypothetical protein